MNETYGVGCIWLGGLPPLSEVTERHPKLLELIERESRRREEAARCVPSSSVHEAKAMSRANAISFFTPSPHPLRADRGTVSSA